MKPQTRNTLQALCALSLACSAQVHAHGDDDPLLVHVMIDQLEWRIADESDPAVLDAQGTGPDVGAFDKPLMNGSLIRMPPRLVQGTYLGLNPLTNGSLIRTLEIDRQWFHHSVLIPLRTGL